MPSPRAILRAPRAVTYALVRLVRAIVVVGFAAFALALLVVRFVVFPQIESYRDTLASLLSRQLGQPVEIAMLSTGWDGWNPKLVVEGFRVVDRVRANPTPLLLLPKLEMIVSWTSVPLMELRLKELVIEGPRLAIRRDRSGVLRIAGLEFDPAQAADELPITDWILRQREIVIRDALIVWDDDLRNAPQLVLDRVQFRLENRFGRHRFGLRGTPPAELASPLDLRGDLALGSMRDWQNAQGTVFVRLDYADVAAWREWLPLPGQIASGTGALRIWFQFAQQEAREIIADVELADVKATLSPELPEIALAHLSGRVGTRKSGTTREVFTRALAFTHAGRRGARPDRARAHVAPRPRRAHGVGQARLRAAAARAARRAQHASAAARSRPDRSFAVRAARHADARPAALVRQRRCADHVHRGRRVRGSGAPRAGCIPGRHRAFRPVRGHERRRRNQGREQQRDARSPARARGAARVRHVAAA